MYWQLKLFLFVLLAIALLLLMGQTQTYNSATGRYYSTAGLNRIVLTGSAYTNATTTFSTVTGLSFSVSANTNYVVTCQLLFQGSATTAGPKFQFTGPASPTAVAIGVVGDVSATALDDGTATAFSSAITALGTLTSTATNLPTTITLGVLNGANAGTVALQAAANGSGTLTIQPGSFCTIQ